MLYNLLYPHANDWWHALNVFKYITFRTGAALLTSLFLSLLFGRRFIFWLKQQQVKGQPIRNDGPQSHLLTKQGTPTMGGALILFSLLLSTLCWSNLCNPYVWLILGVTLAFGLLGGVDDYIKLRRYDSKGLPGKIKFLLQLFVAIVAVYFLQDVMPESLSNTLAIPFFKNVLLPLGVFFIPFACFVIVGASNAVNLTDGLDGLAIGPVIIAALTFGFICYVVGHTHFAHYLQIHFIPGTGELTVFCGALVGSGLGFLWFNAPPAMVFMGDTGSLSIGAALGMLAVMVKHELVLAIVGGLFVVEALSVIIQVGYFKYTKGKRIFLMAPLHHHFEHKGWSEATIVIRFWIIAIVLALLGLATLKLR